MKTALIIVTFFGLLLSNLMGYTPVFIVLIVLLMSAATFFLYFKDKRAAQNNEWRVSEKTLHAFSILGGWPGALVAQEKFRHKTKKTSFRVVFWVTVIFNIAFFVCIHTPEGSDLFQGYTHKFEHWLTEVTDNEQLSKAVLFLTKFRVLIEV